MARLREIERNNSQEELITDTLLVSRRSAREIALQTLYGIELSGNSPQDGLQNIFELYEVEDALREFIRQLVEKTFEAREELDDYIRKRAVNWEFTRIAVIDKIVLRLAICEFLYFGEIPPKVTMDEAIELSRDYSTEQSSRFVNGILDSVLADLRKTKQLVKTGRGLREGTTETESTGKI